MCSIRSVSLRFRPEPLLRNQLFSQYSYRRNLFETIDQFHNLVDLVHWESQARVGAKLRFDLCRRQWILKAAARIGLVLFQHLAVFHSHSDVTGKMARIVDGGIELVAHLGG